MSVIAMKVTKAEQHPNADRLRVYSFADASGTEIQVVANLTNVYEVGDVAAVATVGTVLIDEGERLEIKEAKIRKIDSFGMAMGLVDHPVGTVLDEKYGVV